jgi:hypothetical protein
MTEQEIKSCDNCNKVYERIYSNGGKLCFGIVNIPFRACDVIRKCQKYDTGKEYLEDLAYDEATEALTGYAATINRYSTFLYARPCSECEVKDSDCNIEDE